jgi:putative membrane protein
MKRMGVVSIACAAAVAIACNSNARTDNRTEEPAAVGTAGESDRTAVHDSEKDFANRMLSNGMAEVELGRMASDRAVNPDVKRYGQMIVQDHTKAGDALKAVAAANHISTAPQIDEQHQDVINKLSMLRGQQFDREFVTAMVDSHEDAVDALQSRVDSTAGLKDRITGNDAATRQVAPEKTDNAPKAAVNEWAASTLPTIRHHLDEAKKLDDRLDVTRSTRK